MSTRERNNRTSPPPRPLMPRLPATTSSLRSSPAPRLANSTTRSTPSPSVAKRAAPTRAPILSPRLHDGGATPIKSLGANITPRSSARRGRPDSPSSTPTSIGPHDNSALSPSPYIASKLGQDVEDRTPHASPRSAASERTDSKLYLGCNETSSRRPVSAMSRANTSPNMNRQAQLLPASETSTFFFRAGDAPQQARPERPPLQKKKSSFVYADGRRETILSGDESSAVGSGEQKRLPMQGQPRGNEYHSSTISSNRSAISSVTTSGRSQPNELASPQGFAAIATRSPSPPKFDFHLSYRKGASQVIRPQLSTNNSLASVPSSDSNRRQSSLDTVGEPVPRQARTISNSSLGSHSSPRSPGSDAPPVWTKRSSTAATQSPLVSTPITRTNSTPLVKEAPPDTPVSPQATPASPPVTAPSVQTPLQNPPSTSNQAPTHSHHNRNQSTDTTLARHERKVLDLEISNSSLLAINRTLEREVRRQKTELRRLRRTTRHQNAARSSWLSDGTSLGGSVADGLPSLDELTTGLSLGDDEDPEGNEDAGVEGRLHFLGWQQHDASEESDAASTALSGSDVVPPSPGAAAAGGLAGPSEQAGKRLRFDLGRHRELLADSQKMNMSLQRCLALTDQLVADGRRAVEHRVLVSEVEIGGRVLSPEEVEEEEEEVEEGGREFLRTEVGEGMNNMDSFSLDGAEDDVDGQMEREAFEYFDLKRSTGTESTLANDSSFGFGIDSLGLGSSLGDGSGGGMGAEEGELRQLRRQGSFLLLSPELAPDQRLDDDGDGAEGRGRILSATLSEMSDREGF